MKSLIPSTKEILRCAVKAANAAGLHALKNLHRRHKTFRVSRHDVKLLLDVESQRAAEAVIRASFPDHDILGEESASSSRRQDSEWLWIIDPIDGTVNFSHALSFWCSSVAVQYRRRTIAGVVFAPALGELYEATTDTPAVCNGTRLRVSRVSSLDAAMVVTGMDRQPRPGTPPLASLNRIALRAQKARILGSAALDLCLVASGIADGYFETNIYLWDIAAADLIVQQAGGTTEILEPPDPRHRLTFMASNGRIHCALKKLVRPRKTLSGPGRSSAPVRQT